MTSKELEERTFRFAEEVRAFSRKTGRGIDRASDLDQLIRASGSVGANYIEANEALSRKDFVMRLRICRKEAKEAHYWLRLIARGSSPDPEISRLMIEAEELKRIFSAAIITIERSG